MEQLENKNQQDEIRMAYETQILWQSFVMKDLEIECIPKTTKDYQVQLVVHVTYCLLHPACPTAFHP